MIVSHWLVILVRRRRSIVWTVHHHKGRLLTWRRSHHWEIHRRRRNHRPSLLLLNFSLSELLIVISIFSTHMLGHVRVSDKKILDGWMIFVLNQALTECLSVIIEELLWAKGHCSIHIHICPHNIAGYQRLIIFKGFKKIFLSYCWLQTSQESSMIVLVCKWPQYYIILSNFSSFEIV